MRCGQGCSSGSNDGSTCKHFTLSIIWYAFLKTRTVLETGTRWVNTPIPTLEPGSTFISSMTVGAHRCRVKSAQLKEQTMLTTSLSLGWDACTRHGRQAFVWVKLHGSLPWGICAPYTADISRWTPKAKRRDCPLHVSRDAGLQQLPRECK